MPLIEVVSFDGHCQPCASSDPELLARWLGETIMRMAPGPQYADVLPLQVRVWPLTLRDGSADWPREMRTTLLPSGGKGPVALVQALTDWLQARSAE